MMMEGENQCHKVCCGHLCSHTHKTNVFHMQVHICTYAHVTKCTHIHKLKSSAILKMMASVASLSPLEYIIPESWDVWASLVELHRELAPR